MDRFAHRKATARVLFQDSQGIPIANRSIQTDLIRHKFRFGSGVFMMRDGLNPHASKAELTMLHHVMTYWLQLFQYATLPYYLGFYEPMEGAPNESMLGAMVNWLWMHNIEMKGHPLCWHTNTPDWLLAKTEPQVSQVLQNRIQRELTQFGKKVQYWDVVNEAVIMPVFTKADNGVTRLCRKIGREAFISTMFQAARRADPSACLVLNDFNTSDAYYQLAKRCLESGAPIDVIGIQSHQHQGFWGTEKFQEIVERFETLGLPLHFTENTLISGDLMPPEIVDLNDYHINSWPTTPAGEERQAREYQTLLPLLFAHESVEAFTVWNLTDNGWLGAPAGLIRANGSKKPAFDVIHQYIHHDWATHCTLHTDSNGFADLFGFMGTYSFSYRHCNGTGILDNASPDFTVQMVSPNA